LADPASFGNRYSDPGEVGGSYKYKVCIYVHSTGLHDEIIHLPGLGEEPKALEALIRPCPKTMSERSMRYVTILTSPSLSASRMVRHNAARASPDPGAAAGGAHARGTAVDAKISEGVSEIDAEARAALTELGQEEKSQPKEE
jgi:hypothetical protein